MLIQHFVPPNMDTCAVCRLYFENVLVWICGAFTLAALVSVLSLIPSEIGTRRHAITYQIIAEQQEEDEEQVEQQEDVDLLSSQNIETPYNAI